MINTNQEQQETVILCAYCKLPIEPPYHGNRVYHDELCRQMYYYWTVNKLKLDKAWVLLNSFYEADTIEYSVIKFLKTLSPSGVVAVIQALGYRWINQSWEYKFKQVSSE